MHGCLHVCMGHSTKVRSRSSGDLSNVPLDFLYESTQKNYYFLKYKKNAHKSIKIYHNFLAILKNEGFKTAPVKKMEIYILECNLYI